MTGGDLRAALRAADPARFDITLRLGLADGTVPSRTRRFRLRDLLVVSLGDGYASGQGSPGGALRGRCRRWETRSRTGRTDRWSSTSRLVPDETAGTQQGCQAVSELSFPRNFSNAAAINRETCIWEMPILSAICVCVRFP